MMKKITLSLAFLLTLVVLAMSGGNAKTALASAQFQFASPLNDNFADATVITALPFENSVDPSTATLEASEPVPFCAQGFFYPFSRTVWYRYTATATGQLTARGTGVHEEILAVYQAGTDWNNLSALGCRGPGNLPFTFMAQAGSTYYFQVGTVYDFSWVLGLRLEVTPPPIASFYYYPSDPSVLDTVQFQNNSFDPAGSGIQSAVWDFGDGASSTDYNASHKYAADGDYSVKLTVTTPDGRTNSQTQTVQMRTHDVAILSFVRPKSGREGDTAKLSVGVNSKRYAEVVEVHLFRSVPNGFFDSFEEIGYLRQTVPAKAGNKTTDFLFSYTFTSADATIGKVVFKAEARLVNARDIFPADNTQTTLPIPVSKRGRAAQAFASSAEEVGWVDDVTGTAVTSMEETGEERAATPAGANRIFIPIAINRN